MSEIATLARAAQQMLVDRGFDIGSGGPNGNGVDGAPGLLTWRAVTLALASIPAGPSGGKADPISMISPSLLALVSTQPASALEVWVAPMQAACRRVEINTIRRVAAFCAQIAHESDFKARAENLNYSVDGLLKTFGRHRISEADAKKYGRTNTRKANQEAIANCIYGGEWGAKNLGNTQPGDGWTFRGVGPLQVTGRTNMTRFAEFIGMPLAKALEYARTLEGGVMSAAWFWEANDINRLADTPGVADETKRINGGSNGLADRAAKFDKLVEAMLKLERSA